MNLALRTAAHPHRPGWWAAAFFCGPGFMIWKGDEARAFPYIDPVPFTLRPTAQVRAAGADSTRYGARSLVATGDELFMFFGGRPGRRVHENTAAPTGYEPNALTTDGETFYLLKEDPYPTLIAVRPRVKHSPASGSGGGGAREPRSANP